MTRVTRFDSGRLSKAERTAQGYLRVPASVTRTGVLTYRNADGSVRRELRHPDDVFDPKSLATLAGAPVTDDHPAFRGGPTLLDATTTSTWMRGFTAGDASRDGQYVAAPLVITDAQLIAKVERGDTEEVSCGYTGDLEMVPGTYNGEAYDCRQRNIVYNHVAIVQRGRAGSDVRLHLDSAAAYEVEAANDKGGSMLVKITLGGKEFEVAQEVHAALTSHLDSLSGPLKSDIAREKERADKAEARADGLAADVTKLNAELKARNDAADPANVRKLAKERRRIEDVAARTLPKETVAKLDSMEDRDVKVAVIKAESKDANLDGKSDAYLDARFDHIADTLSKGGAPNLGANVHNDRQSGAESDADAARRRQNESIGNAWKADGDKK